MQSFATHTLVTPQLAGQINNNCQYTVSYIITHMPQPLITNVTRMTRSLCLAGMVLVTVATVLYGVEKLFSVNQANGNALPACVHTIYPVAIRPVVNHGEVPLHYAGKQGCHTKTSLTRVHYYNRRGKKK